VKNYVFVAGNRVRKLEQTKTDISFLPSDIDVTIVLLIDQLITNDVNHFFTLLVVV
jgi:hypothetical protein